MRVSLRTVYSLSKGPASHRASLFWSRSRFLSTTEPLLILFGSQTGNAAMLAGQLADTCSARRWTVSLKGLDEIPVNEALGKSGPVVVVCSVFGEGEPPDNAKTFYEDVLQRGADGVAKGPYAVFGLGDSRYAMERFNIIGRRFDERLSTLGKNRLLPFYPGDAAGDIEGDFEKWSAQLLEKLEGQVKNYGDTASAAGPTAAAADSSKIQAQEKAVSATSPSPSSSSTSTVSTPSSSSATKTTAGCSAPNTLVRVIGSAPVKSVDFYKSFDASVFSADNPLVVKCVSKNSVLPAGAPADVRPCAELVFRGADVSYETGDYLGIFPRSQKQHVDQMLDFIGVDGKALFTLEGPEAHQSILTGRPKSFPNPISVSDFLTRYCDLQRPISTAAVRKLQKAVSDPRDQAKITAALEDKQEAFRQLFWYKSVPEVLAQFPSARMNLSQAVEFLPPARPVLYSIGSSSILTPRDVKVVVGLHKFGPQTSLTGHCSRYLVQDTAEGHDLDGYIKTSRFRLPADPSTPIVMIGVGSGLSPFLGFIEERIAFSAKDNILFFGCMREDTDFICGDRLRAWSKAGWLDLNVAFSHADPNRMVFAQHLMEARGDELWKLMYHQNAFFYVCGHTRLGLGVEEVLRKIVLKGFNGDANAAKVYYDSLYESGRLKLDVFA